MKVTIKNTMKFMNAAHVAVVVKVSDTCESSYTLLEELTPFIDHTPRLILDLNDVLLTSMRIGDLVNIAREMKERWASEFQGLKLLHVSEAATRALEITKLTCMMPVYRDLTEAIA